MRGAFRSMGLLALCAVVAIAPLAEASVLRGLTVAQLRAGADVIVDARVVAVRAQKVDGRIETRAIVRVQQAHKGEPEGRIEVRVLGGELGNRRMIVAGAPTLAKGDHVLLFLYRDADTFRAVGMFQGVWHLDAESVVARASNSGGASLLAPAEGSAAVASVEQSVARLVGRGGAK